MKIHMIHMANIKFDWDKYNEKWMFNQYINLKKSCRTIAKIIGCTQATISRKLIQYNISTRGMIRYNGAVFQNKDYLINQYVNLGKSLRRIAIDNNVCDGTIRYWVHKFNIKVRKECKGEESLRWRGGKHISNGIIKIYTNRNHKSRYIAEHRLVMEKSISRPLRYFEQVHHIDGDSLNNDMDNLYLCKSKSVHGKVHGQLGTIVYQILKEKKPRMILFDKKNGIYTLQ